MIATILRQIDAGPFPFPGLVSNKALLWPVNPPSNSMHPLLHTRWRRLALGLLLLVPFAVLLQRSTENPLHPALDRLSAVPVSERWSHPEMLKIRELGNEAIPALRAVVQEQDRSLTRLLLWVRATWPAAVRYYPRLPTREGLSERRWAACQALQTLGKAARPAAPELVELLRGAVLRDVNAATMALYAIGIDGDICDRLSLLLEQERQIPDGARMQIIGALSQATPPSERTVQVLVDNLNHPTPAVQGAAAEALGRLQIRTPGIIAKLSSLQSGTTDETVAITVAATVWELEKDASLILPRVLTVLTGLLAKPIIPFPGGGNGGQAVESADQAFLAAGALFQKLDLAAGEKAQSLAMLEAWGEKSDRIFIRMLLLPSMISLGLPAERGLSICRAGLSADEDYYRLQAARLLALVCEKHPQARVDLSPLLRSPDVGVRVYAARIHWQKHHQAGAVIPVLVEAIDRSKHQSYSYEEFQSLATQTLGEIGPPAREAIGPLEKLALDPNPKVAAQAADAASKIRR